MPTPEAIATAVAATLPTFARGWYAVNLKKGTDEAEISIYDAIGAYGITAEAFIAELEAITAKTINLRINTPGGEVFDATAIYNALLAHPAEILVHIEGVAASAGSYIAMSGDEVRMADNAYMMIHNAHGGVVGEAEDMRKYAEVLDKMNANIAGMYDRKSAKGVDHWRGLMDAETWFTAEEAAAEGLVDVVYTAGEKVKPAKASFDFTIYNKIPDPVKNLWGLKQPESIAAPEDSTRVVREEPPPAVSQETTAMADTSAAATQAAPAQNPAAGQSVTQGDNPNPNPQPVSRTQELETLRNATEQSRIQAATRRGADEATTAATNRLKAIAAACPGNPQMALDAFLAGQSPEAVKLAFEAAAKVQLEAAARAEEQSMEIARLKAQIEIGGHAGIPDMDFAASDDDGSFQVDPKVRAEQEWDQKPGVRKGWTSKARYVAVRVAELTGNLRSAPATARAR
jgi:ATP-dependent Clp protease protease subunit